MGFGPEAIKLFSYPAQLSKEFYMLISIKISRNSAFSRLREAECAIFLLIIVKMPTIVNNC